MAELKRTFTGGKMDKDTDERIVQNGLYREALNISVATSEDSDVGAAQNILGNTKVTDVIQHRNYSQTLGDESYFGDNYHVAAIVNPQTNMLYRFVHTASPSQGIWMDRIIEFDTSKSLSDTWDRKEHAVFVDIFKVSSTLESYEDSCLGESIASTYSEIELVDDENINQLRWGMKVGTDVNESSWATIVKIDYPAGKIILNKSINRALGSELFFYGDRNLNFGDVVNNSISRSITGINIIDDMIFWTDNTSEPKKINIERSKEGSKSSSWTSLGRGIRKIDDFNQHTLLIVEEENPIDKILNESACYTSTGCTKVLALNYDPAAIYDYLGNDITLTGYTQQPGWDTGCITEAGGCTHAKALNYDPNANIDDGSCCYTGGCTDDGWCQIDQAAVDIFNSYCTSDPSLCSGFSAPAHVCGYTSPNVGVAACNYNPNACDDDGSCINDGCNEGCTSASASNYDSNANTDDGSCLYWVYEDCECVLSPSIKRINYLTKDECELVHNTNSGCCADNPIYGCMDVLAVNYDSNADCPCDRTLFGCDNDITGVGACDGPGNNECCQYAISGCIDPLDINYNPLATIDDPTACGGVEGCTDVNACNFDANASINDGTCEYTSCVGCTDNSQDANGVYYAQNYDPNATQDDGSCIYLETWECIQSYWGCVQMFNGTGSFTTQADCEFHCQVPSWDCNGSDGSCYDPGNGTGAYPTEALCLANCSTIFPVTWECDLYGSNAGSCYDPLDGSGQYTSLTACEAACDPIPDTWDCDGLGSCSSNTTGNGMFTSLPACQNYCRVPATFDCINGQCIDPLNGNGQYPNYAACVAGGCTPLPAMGWDCDPNSKVCSQVVGGPFSSQSNCIANSGCSQLKEYYCDSGPQCTEVTQGGCASANIPTADCYASQADCDNASNNCYMESYDCDTSLGTCSDPNDGTGAYAVDGVNYFTGTSALNACNNNCGGGSTPATYNCVIAAGSISCVDPLDGTGGYTDAGAPAIYGDAQTWCESDMNNSTSFIAGCRDWSSYCSGSSCAIPPGGYPSAYGTPWGNAAVNSLTNTPFYYGTWGPSQMGYNAAGIHVVCGANCTSPAAPPCQDPGAYNYNQGTDACYYPGCCSGADNVGVGAWVLPTYTGQGAGQNSLQSTTYKPFDYTNPPNSNSADLSNTAIGPTNPHPGCSSDYPYFWHGLWDGQYATTGGVGPTWGYQAPPSPTGVTHTGAIADAYNTSFGSSANNQVNSGNIGYHNSSGNSSGYCVNWPSKNVAQWGDQYSTVPNQYDQENPGYNGGSWHACGDCPT